MGWQRGWAKRRACDAPQEVGRPDVTLYTPSTGGSSRGNRITALEQRGEVAQLRQPEIGRDPVAVCGRGPVQQMVALPSGRGSPTYSSLPPMSGKPRPAKSYTGGEKSSLPLNHGFTVCWSDDCTSMRWPGMSERTWLPST